MYKRTNSPQAQTAIIEVARGILTSSSTRKMDWPGVVLSSDVVALDARAWAVDTFGIPNMNNSVWFSTGHVFFFKHPKDLMMFKLKWS